MAVYGGPQMTVVQEFPLKEPAVLDFNCHLPGISFRLCLGDPTPPCGFLPLRIPGSLVTPLPARHVTARPEGPYGGYTWQASEESLRGKPWGVARGVTRRFHASTREEKELA